METTRTTVVHKYLCIDGRLPAILLGCSFTGKEQDPTTEQVFLRARNDNPGNGRFLQQDSVLGSANEPRTLHRYTYAFNNPVNYTDPAGLMPDSDQPTTPNSGSDGSSDSGNSSNPPHTPDNHPDHSANDGRPDRYSHKDGRGSVKLFYTLNWVTIMLFWYQLHFCGTNFITVIPT